MLKKVSCFILLIFLFILTSCNNAGFLTSVTNIRLYDGDIKAAEKEIYEFLDNFEKKISEKISSSEISKINKAKKDTAVTVSNETIELLNIARDVYNKTDGAFNPCIYPVLKLYDFNKKTIPNDNKIDALLPYTDFNDLTITANTVIKKYDEIKIDLGGIAKGYAADKCVEIAKKHNVTSGIIDIGRNIYILGEKKDTNTSKNSLFTIGITNPRNDGDLYFAKIDLSEISAVTSGDYERYFIKDGVRYCHILDGLTGRKPDSNLISVSVFGTNSTLCDGYSTALFVMGMNKAIEFVKNNNLSVILIDESKNYYLSENLSIYNIDKDYKLYEAR